MSTTGGSVISISLNGRQFAVPTDADFTIKLGGFENETQANGDGSTRKIKTRVPWGITGAQVSTDDSQQDHEYIQGLADSDSPIDVVAELASGALYTGKGEINGELQRTTQNTVTQFDLMGAGKLKQQ
jgi:hypothetical protein